MNWIEVRVTVTPEAVEAVAHLLLQEGAGGVVEEGPAVRTAYLADVGDVEARIDRIRRSVAVLDRFGLDPGPAKVEWRRIAEESWAHAWKEHFHTLRIGERIVIRPSWRSYTPGPGEVVIDLDPGMAFGTGSHPTTALCLQALEKLVRPEDVVYDIGTGSGILAIAAALLGAGRVEACDIDPVAVRVAAGNVENNRVSDRVRVVQGNWRVLPAGEADLVVANIVASVIIEMAQEVPRLVKPGGHFVASGIIVERLDEVKDALASSGVLAVQEQVDGEWAALIGRVGEKRL